MDLAKRLIDEAARGGADGIKFQTYKAETIASKNSPSYWDTSKEPTTSQYELFKKYDRFWKNEYESLKQHCDKVGIDFLSTPFDVESAEFLNELMDAFKISSSDITNRPFIEYMANFNKPVILSTGASYLWEVEEALEWLRPFEAEVILLHCVLNYPTPDPNAHLGMIVDLKRRFPDHRIGYSDHTLPCDMKPIEIAALLGAEIIEKHFTFDKSLPGNDHYHAMDMNDLRIFLNNWDRTQLLLGDFNKRPLDDEASARRNARRSLVAAKTIPAGKMIERDDLTWKRPAFGISPRYYHDVVGRISARDIQEDEILQWSMLTDPE
ncbi:MAG: acetylneuraminic acid synthetase [bacterium]|nr:acetylneuraminic acid synthetase [bacterium]